VLEHNLMAISRIYLNIALSQLSFILHIDVKRAEKIAATMISEHRLKAKIDQVGKQYDMLYYYAIRV